MNRNRRLGVYLLAVLALFSAGLMGPRAGQPPARRGPARGLGSNENTGQGVVAGTANRRPTDRPAD